MVLEYWSFSMDQLGYYILNNEVLFDAALCCVKADGQEDEEAYSIDARSEITWHLSLYPRNITNPLPALPVSFSELVGRTHLLSKDMYAQTYGQDLKTRKILIHGTQSRTIEALS
jgi:hypothetical protein